MKKYCPPGFFCIEQFTLLLLLILLFGLCYIFNNISLNINLNRNHTATNNNNLNKDTEIHKERTNNKYDNLNQHFNISHNNQKTNFEDPYNPPLKQNQFIPINIKTQSYNKPYTQNGILTRLSNNEQILPLFGRPLISNRDKWNFYTMTDKTNMIKLPIIYKNKRSTSEYGCDNLYTGDIVKVEGYNDTFKVTIYDNEGLTYLPY
jgi:hypothetical protein